MKLKRAKAMRTHAILKDAMPSLRIDQLNRIVDHQARGQSGVSPP